MGDWNLASCFSADVSSEFLATRPDCSVCAGQPVLFDWIEWLKAEPKLRLDAGGDSSHEAAPCITPEPKAETRSAPAASKQSGMSS